MEKVIINWWQHYDSDNFRIRIHTFLSQGCQLSSYCLGNLVGLYSIIAYSLANRYFKLKHIWLTYKNWLDYIKNSAPCKIFCDPRNTRHPRNPWKFCIHIINMQRSLFSYIIFSLGYLKTEAVTGCVYYNGPEGPLFSSIVSSVLRIWHSSRKCQTVLGNF